MVVRDKEGMVLLILCSMVRGRMRGWGFGIVVTEWGWDSSAV
jgi:hypothetical protein